jgi:hypothetical protein
MASYESRVLASESRLEMPKILQKGQTLNIGKVLKVIHFLIRIKIYEHQYQAPSLSYDVFGVFYLELLVCDDGDFPGYQFDG